MQQLAGVIVERLRRTWFGSVLALLWLSLVTIVPTVRQCFGIAAKRGEVGGIVCSWGPALESLRQPANDGVGFVHDDDPRMPDLLETVMDNSTTCVGQARVFPTQNHGNISYEALLCTVDAINVDDPYPNGNLSWPRVSVRPLD